MILILDTETTGLDPKNDRLVEVAWARYDERHGFIDCASWLVRNHTSGPDNPAEYLNGISTGMLRAQGNASNEFSLRNHVPYLEETRCIVAHNAAFDEKWIPFVGCQMSWVCSKDDIEWPREQGRRVSLEKLALAHGIGVMPGHRAIYDVLTLVRVFARVAEMGVDVEALITKAMRPKALIRSTHPFADNIIAKAHGFSWDGARKDWTQRIAIADIAALKLAYPFNIQEIKQ
jgi:DNA polymerase-3 subunit epsilon